MLVASESSVFVDTELVEFGAIVGRFFNNKIMVDGNSLVHLTSSSWRPRGRKGLNQFCVGSRVSLKDIAVKLN